MDVMLSLEQSHSALDGSRQRFLHAVLPPDLSRHVFAAFDPWDYDTGSLELGRVAWEQRMLEEYRAHAVFTDLLTQLTHLGFAFDIIGTAVRLVRDEARHVELCRRMIAALGSRGPLPAEPNLAWLDPSVPLLRSVVRTVIGSLCVEETLSMYLLAATCETTVDPLAKKLITRLASDESSHSVFGWTLLSLLLPILSREDREDIACTLPKFLSVAEDRMAIPEPELVGPADFFSPNPLNPFGYLPQKVRDEIFYDTMEYCILDRFESLGIAARQAWATRSRA